MAASRPASGASAETALSVTQALLDLGRHLTPSSDVDFVLHEALRLAGQILGADHGVILTVKPGDGKLILRSSLDTHHRLPEGGRLTRFAPGEGLAGWVITHEEPVVIDQLVHDARWVRYEDADQEHKSAIGAPLIFNQEVLGAMLLFSTSPVAFKGESLPIVQAAANQAASALYHADLYGLIREQANQQGGLLREQRIEASKSNAILESVAEGVLAADERHRVTLLNAAAEEILHLKRADLLGRPISDIIGVYGQAGERWLRAVETWSLTGSAQERAGNLGAQLELDDGRIVALTVAPVLLDQDFLGTVTTFRDVTQQVEVDRLKSEFVATVSHELRTPMTSIKGYVEMLLMQAVGPVTDEQRRFLQTIKTNIDRLGGLVNDLLDISRIESGRVELSLEPVNTVELLGEVREAFLRRARLESKPMNVELVTSSTVPFVRADRNRLRQILNNLVENSFNYTPANGSIRLSAWDAAGNVTIEVSDNGIGIAPGEQPRIFERFYRGEQALNLSVGGTGLGLSIVQQLVEMHQGTLELESEGVPGQGTAFRVSLPAAANQEMSAR
jgi:PAS domain S-box-containing protein